MQRTSRNRLSNLLIALSLIFSLGAVGLGFFVTHLADRVEQGFLILREAKPTRIFSDVFTISIHSLLSTEEIQKHLDALQYRKSQNPSEPGEYAFKRYGGGVTEFQISTKEFHYPYDPDDGVIAQFNQMHMRGLWGSRFTKLLFQSGKIIEISENGKIVDHTHLEPAPIAILSDSNLPIRTFAPLEEIPSALVQGVISIEDPRFFEHQGLDPKGIIRALVKNFLAMGITQGGSTITQQLAKNMFLTNKKTFTRKFVEAIIAVILEARYSKDQIIERYLNEVYYGQMGKSPILGVKEASNYYFGKNLTKLSLHESALLAGILRGPFYYHPIKKPDRTIARRNRVLEKMAENNVISREEYQAASKKDLSVVIQTGNLRRGSTMVDTTRERFRKIMESLEQTENLYSEGYEIYTGINSQMQEAAEKSVQKISKQVENRIPKKYRFLLKVKRTLEKENAENPFDESDPERGADSLRLEASLISVSPKRGLIRAIVGGRDYQESNFNRIFYTKRQPGSTFKPFVYLSAFSQKEDNGNYYGPYSLLSDAPFEIELPNGDIWKPQNFDGKNAGFDPITLRKVLAESKNIPTARLAHKIGISSVIEMAQRAGINGPFLEVPSVALGSIETSPVELATAYSTIGNLGIKNELTLIRAIRSQSQSDLFINEPEPTRALPEEETALLIDTLKTVVDEGTAKKIRTRGIQDPLAGKTGTTNDFRDSWFVGMSPELITISWMGFDKINSDHPILKELRLTGSSAALPIWLEFHKNVGHHMRLHHEAPDWPLFQRRPEYYAGHLDSYGSSDLAIRMAVSEDSDGNTDSPPLIRVKIDSLSGKRAHPICQATVFTETFISGREPLESCFDR